MEEPTAVVTQRAQRVQVVGKHRARAMGPYMMELGREGQSTLEIRF